MKAMLSVCLLLLAVGCRSQTISYFNQGFLRQPDAASDRRYLGVSGSNEWIAATTALTNIINSVSNNAWHTTGNTLAADGTLGTLNNHNLLLTINSISYGGLFTDGGVVVGNSATHGVVNNAIAIGSSAFGGGASCIAIGNGATAGASRSLALGQDANASGIASAAIGYQAAANNDGSFVWNDLTHSGGYSDLVADQFVVSASGGIDLHSWGAGVFTDGPLNSTNTINSYNATGSSFTYNAQANPSVAAGQSPLGNWGFLSLDSSQTVNVAVKGTYYVVAAYQHAYTNRFGAALSTGYLTNTIAGWYRIGIGCSAAAPTANDAMDVDVMVNGVVSEYIASHSTAPSGAPPKYVTLFASGILYLAANSYVSIGITDTDNTGNITILHAQLTIGSP